MVYSQDYVLQPKMMKKPPFTVERTGYEALKGETIPRSHPCAKDELVTRPSDDVATIWDNVRRAVDKFGNAKAMGSRKLIRTHTENKKVRKMVDGQEQEVDKAWTYFELSEYHYMSYLEYEKLLLQCASGLRNLGMGKDDRLLLFAATSANWLAMAHAAASQSMPIVTAYDTLGEEGLRHSMIQTQAKAIYLDGSLLNIGHKCLKDAKGVEYVIYHADRELDDSALQKLKTDLPHLKVLAFEELRQLGEGHMVGPVPPGPEDLACIMYTSGSTGPPKGVLIKHKGVVASMAGVQTIMAEYISPGESLLTYLPQAHILEFVFENICLFWGGVMGYGSPKTLSDSLVRNCKGDIREFKPTILVGVPAVWENVRKGIVTKVNAGSFVVKNMFWGAMAAKQFMMTSGLPGSGILDSVVFKKLKDATGGRLRICMNGGGPIAKDTLKFISLAITPMISGYGLTETCAMGALQDPMAWDPTVLGNVPGSVEVKLVDFAEAGYFATNTPPQGEIWIRGAPVTEGYLDNDQETKEVLTSDGWFKSGDIGQFKANGHLEVIDRKKNLVKTLSGEYIALEKLESVYRAAAVVQNICVHAAQDKSKPIAIIVPVEHVLQKLAGANGIDKDASLETLVHDKKLNTIVLRELQKAGRDGALAGIEIIDGVVMSDEEWTAQNGLVTAAQKLQRRKLVAKFQKEIDQAYGGK